MNQIAQKIQNAILIIPTLVGSTKSIVVHTFMFAGIYSLLFFGWELDSINLILTTIVSLEAIYLSIFIQLSVNMSQQNLNEVKLDVDEINNNLDDLEEDIEDFVQLSNNSKSDQESINKTDIQVQLLELKQQIKSINTNLNQVLKSL